MTADVSPGPDAAEWAEVHTQLAAMPRGEAGARIEHAIAAAVRLREFESVLELMYVLVRYDPHRADRLYRLLAHGEVTMPLDELRALLGDLPDTPQEGA